MNREIPEEAAMFQVRDLMSKVFPRAMAENPCGNNTGIDDTVACDWGTTGANCPDTGGTGPVEPQDPPQTALAMLAVLRDQMRLALLPA